MQNLMAALAIWTAAAAAPDLPAPQIFAPGVISDGSNDGAPAFAPDGKTLYFERTNGKWAVILEARQAGGRWQKPVLAPFSGFYSDQQPAMSPDGRYLVYVSSRGVPGHRASHLYRVDRTAAGWSDPVELPPEVNISSRVFKPSIAADGDLYFMADTGPGGAPKWRLFRAARTSAGYAKAEPLPFSGPDDADVDPFIAPDGSYLIFSSNTRSALKDGHEHLFMARHEGSGWSAVRPLRYAGDDWGADDGEAQVGPDGRTLYFTSGRVLPFEQSRDRETAVAALARLDEWDNSNANVWMLPLAPYLTAR